MSDKLIFEVFVDIDDKQMSRLNGPAGEAMMIPFTGTVKGEVFNGRILPGGVDTHTVNQNGVRHMSARYMLEGKDKAGAECRIYIDNQGWFIGETPMPFKTIPAIMTDSKTLAPYLHCNKFRTEGYIREGGAVIKFFEIIG